MVLLKNFLIAMVMVGFVAGCSGNDAGGPDAKSAAITKIADYAAKGEKTPTVQDYINAGITGVTADNIEAVNAAVRLQDRADVDSAEKIQVIVDLVVAQQGDDDDVGGDDEDNGGNPPTDTTKPVITLVGSATVNLTTGDSYTDAGATATDDVDGDITAQIVVNNPVDTSTAGTYYVTYNVQDSAGNVADEVVRTVNVQAAAPADTTKPVISLNGAATVNLTVGDSYTDAGATATDDVDGDITAQIVVNNPVDTSTAGTYYVTYNVQDSAGNVADEVVRTVNVQAAAPADTTKPVITLVGSATVNLTTGDSYTDAGATATDDVDGDITAQIVVNNPVDTSTAGTYYVTYNVQDSAGNVADEVVRTVIVSDPQPIALDLNITVTPAQPVDGEAFKLSVTENAGLTFTDPQWSGDVSGSDVNITVAGLPAGDHTITVTVKDTNGFEHNQSVIVTVVPIPPVSMTLTITTTCTVEDGNDCTLTAESNETISDVRWSGDGVDGVSGNPLTVTGGYTAGDHSVDVNVSDERGYRYTAHLDFHIDPLGAVSLTLDINVSGWLRPSSDENGTRDIKFAGESNDTAHIATWSWDLGDGLSASDQNATRRYTAVGNYTVTLTATDTNGFDHTATADVNITAYNTVERWLKSHNGTAKFEYEADFGDVTSTTGGSAFEDDGAGKLVPSSTTCQFLRDSQNEIRTGTIQHSNILGHFCLTIDNTAGKVVIVDYKEADESNPYYPFMYYDDGTGYGTLPFDERRIYTVEDHRINQVLAGATDSDGTTHALTGMDNNTSLYLYSE